MLKLIFKANAPFIFDPTVSFWSDQNDLWWRTFISMLPMESILGVLYFNTIWFPFWMKTLFSWNRQIQSRTNWIENFKMRVIAHYVYPQRKHFKWFLCVLLLFFVINLFFAWIRSDDDCVRSVCLTIFEYLWSKTEQTTSTRGNTTNGCLCSFRSFLIVNICCGRCDSHMTHQHYHEHNRKLVSFNLVESNLTDIFQFNWLKVHSSFRRLYTHASIINSANNIYQMVPAYRTHIHVHFTQYHTFRLLCTAFILRWLNGASFRTRFTLALPESNATHNGQL